MSECQPEQSEMFMRPTEKYHFIGLVTLLFTTSLLETLIRMVVNSVNPGLWKLTSGLNQE